MVEERKIIEEPHLYDLTMIAIRRLIEKKKNPIFVQLEDGTKLYFTWDEFKRIEGTPEHGKKMLVIMQRREDDNSPTMSQIQKCKIIGDS